MLLIAIGVIIITALYLIIRSHKYWTDRGVQQGKPWPLLGDSWPLVLQKMDLAQMTVYTYNLIPKKIRYYGTYQFLTPKLVIRDPELIKRILVKDFDHFVDHVAVTDPNADPLFSKNLLSLKGDEWRSMRSTLTTSFTSSKMKILFKLISDEAEKFADYFDKNSKEEVQDVEIKDAFSRFTIDVIATTSFGAKVDSLADRNNEFFAMGKEVSELKLTAFFKVLLFQVAPTIYRSLNMRMFREEVNNFFRDLINSTIEAREKKGIYRPDMVQILIEARKGIEKEDEKAQEVGFAVNKEYVGKSKISHEITNEDITAQAVIFFFAGFDSVSSLLTYTTYELAANQEIQDKLRKEVLATIDEHDENISYEAVASMKYMDMVVSESLRKWPPFVTLGRECTKPYTIEPTSSDEKTLIIPKGMAIQIPVWAIHHDPRYYADPEIFDPERFSPENRAKLTPYTFLGFGTGPRGCLGSRFALLEIKIILLSLLRRFRFVTTEKTEIPPKLSKKFTINIRPANGMWIGIQRIKD